MNLSVRFAVACKSAAPLAAGLAMLTLAGCASGPSYRADLGHPRPVEPIYNTETYAPPPARRYSAERRQPRHVPSRRNFRPPSVIVTTGDTLYGISRRYRVSLYELMRANNLSSPEIYPGQSLIIPRA